MDKDVILWVLGAFITVLGFIIPAMWRHSSKVHDTLFERINAMEKSHNDFRVQVAKEYSSKEDVEKLGARLEKALVDGLHEVTASLNTLAQRFHDHQLEDRK